MTVQAVALQPGGIFTGHTDREVSNGAVEMKNELTLFLDRTDIRNRRSEAVLDLVEAAREAEEEGWDGYNAARVDMGSLAQAHKLLMALPLTVPAPEFSVHPNGNVLLEWHIRHRMVFTVSVGYDGGLVYAGIFGSNTTHGTEYFADELPETIARNLSRALS
jgi:hypothetical protein